MFTENLTLVTDLQPLVDDKAGSRTISLEEALSVADDEAKHFGENFNPFFMDKQGLMKNLQMARLGYISEVNNHNIICSITQESLAVFL